MKRKLENISDAEKNWILRTVSKDKTRVNISKPWISDGWLISTTGRRLHMVRLEQEQDRILTMDFKNMPDDCGIIPPSLQDIFPEISEFIPFDREGITRSDRPDIDAISLGHVDLKRWYIEGVLSLDIDWTLGASGDPSSPVWFKSKDGNSQALVMPMLKFDSDGWETTKRDREYNLKNTTETDFPVCPHCGLVDDFDHDGVNEQIENVLCYGCGKTFKCLAELSITYTTWKETPND